jgi:catechol-2,3-dioxygenase
VELPVPYFAGPDGILLELIARHDLLAASSSGRFSSADLLRISEIGLAVPDVPAAVAALQSAFGLPVFGTAAAEFTPLGDHDGLLIVVRQGRPWFPTTASRRRWALSLSPSSCQAAESRWR